MLIYWQNPLFLNITKPRLLWHFSFYNKIHSTLEHNIWIHQAYWLIFWESWSSWEPKSIEIEIKKVWIWNKPLYRLSQNSIWYRFICWSTQKFAIFLNFLTESNFLILIGLFVKEQRTQKMDTSLDFNYVKPCLDLV